MNNNNSAADPYQEAWEANVTKRYRRYYTYIEPAIHDPVIQGYFTLVASILLAAFFIFFALSPTFTTILGLTRKIADQGKLLSAMDAKISSLIIAQENFSQIEPSLPLLDAALPQKAHPEIIFSDILVVASSSGLKVDSLQFRGVVLQASTPKVTVKGTTETPPPPPASKNNLVASVGTPTVDFNITVEGSLPQIRIFMGKMENLPRIISLSIISINQTSTGTKTTNLLTADIAGSGYYLNIMTSTPKVNQ